MMLSKNTNILTLSRAHIRLRNKTLGLFEFLPLHPSPCLGPLMCIDRTNKKMVCVLSKLLLCHHILKNSPQEMWKVTKKFKSQGKTWLMIDLHLLPLPGEGQKKAQEGQKFFLRRKHPEATEPCSLPEVQGWNLKADIFHFKMRPSALTVGMIKCWDKIPMKVVDSSSSDIFKLWADACWNRGFSQAQVIGFLIGVCNFMVHIIWSSE